MDLFDVLLLNRKDIRTQEDVVSVIESNEDYISGLQIEVVEIPYYVDDWGIFQHKQQDDEYPFTIHVNEQLWYVINNKLYLNYRLEDGTLYEMGKDY